MSWWIWVLVAFALLAIEFMSTTMHVGFFGGGALFVALLVAAGWNGGVAAQLLAFTLSSVIALAVFRPIVVRRLKLNETKAVDTMVGEQATALEDIAVQARGRAEMRGSTWSAQNIGTQPLKKGERCTVDRVDGLLLHLRAIGNQETGHG
jgi:membrane protein implicated in regulation of membrane protease activity